jgi:membrane-anchored protein YejM (alkaline phosphatase superfamily)
MKTGNRFRNWIGGETSVLDRYFFLSWLVLMASAWRQFKCIEYDSWVTVAFAVTVFVSYCYLYTIPARLIVRGTQWLLASPKVRLWLEKRRVKPILIVYSLAVFLTAVIDILAFTDFLIYRADGHHVTDTFILNLIFGRGGLKSLGADTATILTFLGIILAFMLLQALILVILVRWKRFSVWSGRVITRPRLAVVVMIVISLFVWQGTIFGFSKLNGYLPVVDASEAFPLYVPVTYGHIAQRLGYVPPVLHVMRLKVNVPKDIVYPLKAIEQTKGHNSYNIIWMVGESWRFDMLDPNIMPQTWQFSQEALNFRQHYSAGNGTRMAIFGMFYGLYGNYWWACLDHERGPVLIDVLLADNYQMCMMTSSNFRYPEYAQTMFVRLPKGTVHEDNPYPNAWQNDRRNVERLIDFMDKRDRSRPFMVFMFFESPHARYYFPPECEIARPYLEDFNYTTTDITKVGPLIKNRYINSCNHLDSQLGRMIKYLKETGLLDSTIVMITGDHGEEFMESGRWGHNSNFTDWQTKVPMVLWVPGEKPRAIDKMTSHLDLPATMLGQLGVTNPPQDYSLGFDMLGSEERDYTVVSDWYYMGCVDHQYKCVFPVEKSRGRQEVLTKGDKAVQETETYYLMRRPMLLKIGDQMREFGK